MRAVATLLLVAASLAGAGCRTSDVSASATASTSGDAGVRTRRVAAGADPRVRIEGRAALGEEGPRFAWPGVTVHVGFVGTTLDVTLRGSPFADQIRDLDAIGVRIDDGPMRELRIDEGVHVYRVARGLARGRHDVTLVKLTEAEQGTITLVSLATDGELVTAKPPRARRLLAIGDSITAGFGIDGPEGCRYDARHANASRTWFFRAADALGAERHVLAWSGRGLVHNYDPSLEDTMPELVERALPGEEGSTYDPTAFVPDAIVVNLGTNDVSRPEHDPAAFARAYGALLARLRDDYPHARVVVAFGPMISDDFPRIGTGTLRRMRQTLEDVVRKRARAGDTNVRLLELPSAFGREGAGCDAHPSAATHARLAGLLVSALADVW